MHHKGLKRRSTKTASKAVVSNSDKKQLYLQRRYQILAALLVAAIGSITLLITHAAGPFASTNPSGGQVNGAAFVRTDDPNSASGSYVQFSENPASACSGGVNNPKGTKVTITGTQTAEYKPTAVAHTTYDATNALWPGQTPDGSSNMPWPVTINGTGPVCWYGGKYTGTWDYSGADPTITWEDPYHHSGGITVRTPNTLIDGWRVDNIGDGINIESGGTNFLIRNVHMTNIKDDCVQNDFFNNGKIEDSLLEGCYSGFSAADYSRTAGDAMNNIWEIDNTLEWSDCSYPYYTRANNCYGLWFKGWYQPPQVGPKLILNNDIFRTDGLSGQLVLSSAAGYKIPDNADLVSCSNNIMVWTGPGAFPYQLPSCFTITKDISVWNNAVAAWKQAHPANAN